MKTIPHTLPRFLWHFCKSYRWSLLGLIGVAFFWALSVAASPYALKLLVDGMTQGKSIWLPALLYIVLNFSTGVILRFYDGIRIFPKMKSEIIAQMFSYLEAHSIGYFQHSFAGTLANKINDIAKSAVNIINYIIYQLLTRFLTLLIGIVAMFLVQAYFAIALSAWSVIFFSAAIYFSKHSKKYSEDYSHSRSQVVGKIVDSIANILNVKIFANENYENSYLQRSLDEAVSKERRLQWYLMKVKVFYSLSIAVLTTCMILLLILGRSQNSITVGDAVLVLTLTTVLIRDFFQIANELATFSEEIGTCQQALTLISSLHQVSDRPNGQPLQVTKGTIHFDRVHFSYKKGQILFVDKSVTIPGGQKVGIVGLTGSGKTTFINLIMRFFDVDAGKIEIDGQNIAMVTQSSLRKQIALIPQDLTLFHRSLLENIRYGCLSASDEEVIEAAKRAHCHEFIQHLPDGYASLVGERGVKLSGGQRQQIAIARAILKNSPILILDEATSALDSTTENFIQKSLTTLMENRTTIVIAHRLSTLVHMDRLLVFKAGRIVEDGTRQELMQLDGHFNRLWDMQNDRFKEAAL